MARPTVLVVDDNDSRRKELCRGLAEFTYEVVSAENAANGMRFATGLSPRVIIASESMEGFGDATVLKFLAPDGEGHRSALVLLTLGASDEGSELPDEVLLLPSAGLTSQGILRKLRTLLVGLELGLECDARLESLIGDFELVPLYDLLPQLQKVVLTGRLLAEAGELAFVDGEVIAARAEGRRGRKAFCRLARTASGSFKLLLGPPGLAPELQEDLLSLMARAMEDTHAFQDQLGKLPDWESKVKLELGPAFFSTQFTPGQQEILKVAQAGRTLRSLVEAVTLADGEALTELLRLAEMGFVRYEEPEIRVRVVTDSTADLPAELARRHRIHVVPLSVLFGDEVYRDGLDINPNTFYKLLAEKKDVHPRTNPPTKGDFVANFRQLVAGSDVVSVHISEKMSQTVVNARAAVDDVLASPEARGRSGDGTTLEVINSLQVSTGLGMLAMFAARMALRGRPAVEIAKRVNEMVPRFHLLFVVDTLEYLARGGRIGKARALVGGLLGIKPILGLVDGEVTAVDRVRGGKAAHPRVVELMKERVEPDRPILLGIGHAAAAVWADRLRTLMEQSFTVIEAYQGEIGPVVGTHVGPGCVGVVVFQPTEEETPLIAPLPAAS